MSTGHNKLPRTSIEEGVSMNHSLALSDCGQNFFNKNTCKPVFIGSLLGKTGSVRKKNSPARQSLWGVEQTFNRSSIAVLLLII